MYFPFAKDEAGQKAPYKIEKMKYYLIAGEPSGDLHGANLIRGLQKADPGAEFRFWGGDCMAAAGGAGSTVGSGGMITKIRAARVLMAAGIDMVICQGHNSDFLIQLAEGQSLGTRFSPCGTVHDITPKKLWIALGDTAKGSLIVDEGAAEALVSRGSSLLAVGVCGVEGSFAREDIVDIVNTSGRIIARGKAGASSSEITLACGRSQREIKGNELLRDLAQRPVVHRDELVVFE